MAEQEQEKKEEPQPEEQGQTNTQLKPEDLEVVKAELEEERKAKAEIEKAAAEKDARLAELEKALTESKQSFTQVKEELTQVKDAHSKAVAKYLDVVKLANPTLPPDVIGGSTIDEIDASVAKAIAIAESVKKSLEAEAKQARVPAGAPTRGGITPEGLSPREKIIAGIAQKQT